MLDKNMFGEVPQVVHNAVVNTLDMLEEREVKEKKSGKGWWSIPRAAVLFLAAFLVTGITVSSVSEVWESYRQRMEEMTHEDYEEFYNMMENDVNRELTSGEMKRYYELEEIYEKNGVFPKGQITVLETGEAYSGKGIALDMVTGILYFPEEALSDEELLQLIDYRHKYVYSIYMLEQEIVQEGNGWRNRFASMTSKEAEEMYIMVTYANTEVSCALCRELPEENMARYHELYEKYREGNLYAKKEVDVIQCPEDYSGEGVVFCVQDSLFYFPERELTDEELIQIIDFTYKGMYAVGKINDEVNFGLREEYPHIDRE